MENKYDIAIVGGGVVGLFTSLALSKLGYCIIHIERDSLIVKNDTRSIAVSYSSVSLMNSLGIWPHVAQFSEPIKKVHVSDKGNCGRAELNAVDEDMPFLGVIVKMQKLLEVALDMVSHTDKITKSFDTNVVSLDKLNNKYVLNAKFKDTDDTRQIHADLVIACDGANSSIRKMLNVAADTSDYNQNAVVFDISTEIQNDSCAYERFMTDGVLAVLPKNKNIMGCVWTVDRDKSKSLISLNSDTFQQLLQDRFGYRLGEIKVETKPVEFPLHLIQSQEVYKNNVLFFGNALHFLHPVSGQGLNLSIRDIGYLYDLLADKNITTELDEILQDFEKVRKADHDRTIKVTDSFIQWFVSDNIMKVASRNFGLHMLQRSKIAKKALSRVMMGKLTRSSTLMRKVVD